MRLGPRGGHRAIDVTSRSTTWTRAFSPFLLGPVALPTGEVARNVENLWQYSKVYPEHVDANGEPTQTWHAWRAKGYAREQADRYPAGRDRRPLYFWLGGRRLSYIQARFEIYVPAYRDALIRAGIVQQLAAEVSQEPHVDLLYFDGYDHVAEGRTLGAVLMDPNRKAGHGFVLWGLLTGDPAVCPWARPRTRVAHCRRDPFDVYVGRSPAGLVDASAPFGNPIKISETCFVCGHVHTKPGETIPCYTRHLDARLWNDSAFRALVAPLAGRVLACHCRPPEGFRGRVRCHAQVLASRLDNVSPALVL